MVANYLRNRIIFRRVLRVLYWQFKYVTALSFRVNPGLASLSTTAISPTFFVVTCPWQPTSATDIPAIYPITSVWFTFAFFVFRTCRCRPNDITFVENWILLDHVVARLWPPTNWTLNSRVFLFDLISKVVFKETWFLISTYEVVLLRTVLLHLVPRPGIGFR